MTRVLPHLALPILRSLDTKEWRRIRGDRNKRRTAKGLVESGWIKRREKFDQDTGSRFIYQLYPRTARVMELPEEERVHFFTASPKTLEVLGNFESGEVSDGRTMVALARRGWLQLSEAGQRALDVATDEEDS